MQGMIISPRERETICVWVGKRTCVYVCGRENGRERERANDWSVILLTVIFSKDTGFGLWSILSVHVSPLFKEQSTHYEDRIWICRTLTQKFKISTNYIKKIQSEEKKRDIARSVPTWIRTKYVPDLFINCKTKQQKQKKCTWLDQHIYTKQESMNRLNIEWFLDRETESMTFKHQVWVCGSEGERERESDTEDERENLSDCRWI